MFNGSMRNKNIVDQQQFWLMIKQFQPYRWGNSSRARFECRRSPRCVRAPVGPDQIL